jgi:colanic acid/amylovoran biosynthesis glycosyltransferase
VDFLGARAYGEVLAWMRKAAMLVLPSMFTRTGRVEGLGMVLLEAAATGVPVIGSQVGGIPEGVLDGETGFLVPEKDPDALAARIEYLLDNPATRARMGVQARAFVTRKFDLHRQTETLEAIYDRVASEAVRCKAGLRT